MKSLEDILQERKTTAKEALDIFDFLEPATVDFMIGRWKGKEIESNHQMDGLLAATGWYGKLFLNPEEVHPLLFYTKKLTELYSVNPRIVPMHMKFPKSNVVGILMKLAKPFLQTKKSSARLRMIEYRNRATATMCYDEKAILDHFAKIDETRVMGVMDLKGVPEPYIFILERDDDSDLKQNF
jgi:hypothetical protein